MSKEDEGYQEKMKCMWRNSSHAILKPIISQSNNSSETSSLNTKTCQSLIKIQKSFFVIQKHHQSPSAKSGTREGEKLNGWSKKTQLTVAKLQNTPSNIRHLFSRRLWGCQKLPILAWGKFEVSESSPCTELLKISSQLTAKYTNYVDYVGHKGIFSLKNHTPRWNPLSNWCTLVKTRPAEDACIWATIFHGNIGKDLNEPLNLQSGIVNASLRKTRCISTSNERYTSIANKPYNLWANVDNFTRETRKPEITLEKLIVIRATNHWFPEYLSSTHSTLQAVSNTLKLQVTK